MNLFNRNQPPEETTGKVVIEEYLCSPAGLKQQERFQAFVDASGRTPEDLLALALSRFFGVEFEVETFNPSHDDWDDDDDEEEDANG